MLITWVPPSEGFIKLNVDGSSRGNPGLAGCGGLLRDFNGKWIKGFVSFVGFSEILKAELIGIRNGLQLAWKLGYKRIKCESDCLRAIKIIHSGEKVVDADIESILEEIDELLGREWDVSIYHVYREVNSCADFLAKIGSSSRTSFRILSIPPRGLSPLLEADANETFHYRS